MDADDDPFAAADPDRTLIAPPAGRHAVPPPAAPATRAEPFGSAPDDASAGAPAGSPIDPDDPAVDTGGLNPLVAAANPLLDLVPRLRATPRLRDVAALRDRLARSIRAFEARAAAAGVAPRQILAARYMLCTLLDEAAASTPWGGSGVWASQSLLVSFHNEAWGGEKVFRLLARLAEDPAANLDLLELLYVCLALGFEGRYRVLDNGPEQLARLRERLAQLLRRQRGDREPELSPRWQGTAPVRRRLPAILPPWIVFAACGAVLIGAYLWLAQRLDRGAAPVHAQILALGARAAAPRPPAAPRAPEPRLAALLAPEIRQERVAVRSDAGRSVVTLRGDGLFAPGSATVLAGHEPLLARIAQALAAVPGPVLVTGHSDNVPIVSARFPSNWHLSQERARAVVRLLQAQGVAADRLRAEGRADAEPIAPNDSPANRARNRRVEIALLPQRAGAQAGAR